MFVCTCVHVIVGKKKFFVDCVIDFIVDSVVEVTMANGKKRCKNFVSFE